MNKIGKKLGYKENGFTIIEVMIVLAVAGLIMAIVLVAIPQLQRSQRDEASRNTVNRVLAEMGNYAGNNNGEYPLLPADLTSFKSSYLCGFSGTRPCVRRDYQILTSATNSPVTAVAPVTQPEIMSIHPGATCDGENVTGTVVVGSNAPRSVALRVELERSGTYYCADNS